MSLRTVNLINVQCCCVVLLNSLISASECSLLISLLAIGLCGLGAITARGLDNCCQWSDNIQFLTIIFSFVVTGSWVAFRLFYGTKLYSRIHTEPVWILRSAPPMDILPSPFSRRELTVVSLSTLFFWDCVSLTSWLVVRCMFSLLGER